jgi:RNA polymerase sigma-70 factor, ECF subfamily
MSESALRTDEELMLSVKGGNKDAFTVLYRRHQNGLVNFCYQMLRNYEDAADVFQEAFRYLFLHAATYEPSAKFTTYLYRIARNLCIDILRRRRRWNLQQLDTEIDVPEEGRAQESKLENEEVEAHVKKALEEVPEPYREVVLLRLTQGLAYEDIASITEAPLGTVKSRLHAGFNFLRQIMKRKKLIE